MWSRPERNLIIDTGGTRKCVWMQCRIGLKELGVDLKNTDFFITHLHADHLGLVSSLVTETSKIYFNQRIRPIEGRFSLDDFVSFARWTVIWEGDWRSGRSHPALSSDQRRLRFFTPWKRWPISIGNYAFRCVETPDIVLDTCVFMKPIRRSLWLEIISLMILPQHSIMGWWLEPIKAIFRELRQGL